MIPQLMQASLEGAVAAGIAWLLCRFVPRLPASIKTWVWCAVAAKFLATLVWTTPLALPVLPPAPAQRVSDAAITMAPTTVVTSVVSTSATSAGAAAATDAALWLSGAAFAVWLTGVIIAAAFAARRWQRARQMIRRSAPAPASLTDAMIDVAIRMGLAKPPIVRVSDDISSPLVVGAGRATVIVPSRQFAAWTAVEQRMAMAHECAHIRRADLRIGCVPAMCEALFFFHPLARMAAREYALWREAACDAEVISALDLEPVDYGRLLVSFGVSQPRVGLAAGSASPSASHLKRRLLMLTENASPTLRSRVTAGVIALAALLAIVPVRLTARADLAPKEIRIESGMEQYPPAPPAPPAPPPPPSRSRLAPLPPAPPSPAELPTPALAPLPEDLTAPLPPLPPSPPPHRMAPLPPAPPPPPAPRAPRWHEAGLNFVLVTSESHHVVSGDMSDIRAADRYRQGSEPLLWFRRNGHEYIVRDRSTLDQALALWKPVNELGDAQGKVGERQGALGAEQGVIGARQGEIGARQGQLGQRQAELSSRAAELNLRAMRARTEAERRDLEQSRQKLEAEMKALNADMNTMSRQMERESAPMNDLSRRMEALSREMKQLSERMEAASRAAETAMLALIDKAVASGTAQQVR